jgi:hypothetical protein
MPKTSKAVWDAANRVHAAWTNAGPVPAYHIEKQMQMLTEWPTLFNALNDLVYVMDMESTAKEPKK